MFTASASQTLFFSSFAADCLSNPIQPVQNLNAEHVRDG
jgi:hypothetical protein